MGKSRKELESKGPEWKKWIPEPRKTAQIGGNQLTYEAVTILDRLNNVDTIASGLHEQPEQVDGADGLKKTVPGIYKVLIDAGLRSTIEPLEELNRAGYIENAPDPKLNGGVNKRKWRLTNQGMAVARQASMWVKENLELISNAEDKVLG